MLNIYWKLFERLRDIQSLQAHGDLILMNATIIHKYFKPNKNTTRQMGWD